MDLDETVLDNWAFASFLHDNDLDYTDDLWSMYERGLLWTRSRLVPWRWGVHQESRGPRRRCDLYLQPF